MEEVEKYGKSYDLLCFEYNPKYQGIIRANDIVKDFIRKKKLIIYGGTAIDMAMRLKGGKIYPDEMLPLADLDFFSPNNIEDAYELCDILFKEFADVRCIHGLHIQTMRVDIGNNIWIADISYCPKVLFDKLEYLIFDGMRVVHPYFQRIDVHKSLSFPYDYAPMEVVFNRYNKDLKRFNALDALYPYEVKMGVNKSTYKCSFNIKTLHKYIINGFLAYALIFVWMEQKNYNLDDILNLNFTIDKNGNCTCDIPMIDLIAMEPERAAEELDLKNGIEYYPLHNFIPERCTGESEGVEYNIYSSRNKWITINSIRLPETGEYYRVANYNAILLYFLANSLVNDDKKMANLCSNMYYNLLTMVNKYAARLDAETAKVEGDLLPRFEHLFQSPLFVGSNYYGAENHSEVYEILRLKFDGNILPNIKPMEEPKGYTPSKSLVHPTFAGNEHFKQDGGVKKKL